MEKFLYRWSLVPSKIFLCLATELEKMEMYSVHYEQKFTIFGSTVYHQRKSHRQIRQHCNFGKPNNLNHEQE